MTRNTAFTTHLTHVAFFALAAPPVPDVWRWPHRRIERGVFAALVIDRAAALGRPGVTRHAVYAAADSLINAGFAKTRRKPTATGVEYLIPLVHRAPSAWRVFPDFLKVPLDQLAGLAEDYGFDLETKLSLDELGPTPRERAAVKTALAHAGPRACARCGYVKSPEAFRPRAGTPRRRQDCRDCELGRAPRPEEIAVPEPVAPAPVLRAVTPPALAAPAEEAGAPDPAMWGRHVLRVMVRADDTCEAGPRHAPCHDRAVDAERVDPSGPWHADNALAVCSAHRGTR